MDHRFEGAIRELTQYNDLREAIDNLTDRIDELREQCGHMIAVRYDKPAVMGNGGTGYEDAIADNIDRRFRLERRLKNTREAVERIEKGLAGLEENERKVLQYFYISREPGYIDRLITETGYAQAQIYRLKDKALSRYVRIMWGVE